MGEGSVRVATAAVGAELLSLGQAHGSERVAARAGLTMLLALGALAATGHVAWALYATFGAFASIYGGRLPVPGRWRTQAAVGLVFAAAVGLGAAVGTSPERELLGVPVTAVVAAVVAMLATRRGWTPPGSLFPVFAVSACSAVPGDARQVGVAVAVALGTATVAVALGRMEQWRWPVPGIEALGPPDGLTAGALLGEGARNLVAVGLAGTLATAFGIGHPYWAMVAAVAPMTGALVRHRVARGVNRALGTMVGLAPAALLLGVHLPLWATVLVVAGLQASVELLIGRHYGLAMVCITPLALVVGHAANPGPVAPLLVDRAVETLLGAAVGIVVVVFGRDTRSRERARSDD